MNLNKSKKMLLFGAGWFGSALAKEMILKHWDVWCTVRGDARAAELIRAGADVEVFSLGDDVPITAPHDVELCVVAIPPGKDETIVAQHHKLANELLKFNIKKLILISSTGLYPNDGVVNENTSVLEGKLRSIEESYADFSDRFCILRFSGLIGPGRYPGRFFSGKTSIGNGLASVNLIHMDDCIGIVQAIYDKDYSGIANGVMPLHYTRKQFYTEAARLKGMELPHFKEVLLSEKRVESIILEPVLKYEFQHADPMEVLRGWG